MATDQRLLTPEGPLQQLRQAFSGGFGPNNLHFSCFLFPVSCVVLIGWFAGYRRTR
jgi:hypothetical protein